LPFVHSLNTIRLSSLRKKIEVTSQVFYGLMNSVGMILGERG
jgi:hypothetical protein